MYIAVLGRQPEISLAEIRAQFGNGRRISGKIAEFDVEKSAEDFLVKNGVLTEAGEPKIDRFGGVLKFGRELEVSPREYLEGLPEGKIVLGVSDYSRRASRQRAQGEALKLKKILKKQGRNVRVLPNSAPEISSAVACHEKLGRKLLKVELILMDGGGGRDAMGEGDDSRDGLDRRSATNGKDAFRGKLQRWFVSVGSQDIEAYARRDQARPARDAKVGMLPPKLAQILINLCGPLPKGARVLDPFCGTGVVLQEARLMGYQAYGTDLSERIVKFAETNMEWQNRTGVRKNVSKVAGRKEVADAARALSGFESVAESAGALPGFELEVGDAMNFQWKLPIEAVTAEIYLGPPMSTPPVEIKLKAVQQECGTILRGFLKNLGGQIKSGTPVVLAIPAWRRPDGRYARLKFGAERFGFERTEAGKSRFEAGWSEKNAEKNKFAAGRSEKTLDGKAQLGYNGVNKLGFAGLLYARPDQIVAREIIVLRKK